MQNIHSADRISELTLAQRLLNTYAKSGRTRVSKGIGMTARDFAELLRAAGIVLPEQEVQAAWPSARKLLDLANQLPGPRDD
jgi:hypothetical protein